MTMPTAVSQPTEAKKASSSRTRVLWATCAAHALHDGYGDMIYALLPIWQAEFQLGYASLALVRGVYTGTMAMLQLSAGRLASWIGGRATLALGTLLAALGYAAAGLSGGLLGLCVALALSGSGSSTQHPLASGAVSRAYGRNARGPLGIYNFAGDLGKAALPAAISLLATMMPWRHALWAMSMLGGLIAAGLALWLPSTPRDPAIEDVDGADEKNPSATGFRLLLAIGVLDSGVRMGLLTFLPFLLKGKGISTSMLGTALAMVFIGGAAGKFICGWLGQRMGVIGTVLTTECGTAMCILSVMLCPLIPALALLPLLGALMNGTSSVLYGTVPELAPGGNDERAFALFYTGTIGSSAISPVLYGLLGDRVGIQWATCATALTAITVVPLALALRARLTLTQQTI